MYFCRPGPGRMTIGLPPRMPTIEGPDDESSTTHSHAANPGASYGRNTPLPSTSSIREPYSST